MSDIGDIDSLNHDVETVGGKRKQGRFNRPAPCAEKGPP